MRSNEEKSKQLISLFSLSHSISLTSLLSFFLSRSPTLLHFIALFFSFSPSSWRSCEYSGGGWAECLKAGYDPAELLINYLAAIISRNQVKIDFARRKRRQNGGYIDIHSMYSVSTESSMHISAETPALKVNQCSWITHQKHTHSNNSPRNTNGEEKTFAY